MKLNQTRIQTRITVGKESLFKTTIGIPIVYQGMKLDPKVEDKLRRFLKHKVAQYDSALLILGYTLEDSYKAGARLAEIAYEEKICRCNIIGFKALLNVHKASFRDPDKKALLKDKINYSDVLIFANIDKAGRLLWSDPRDSAVFRSILHGRMLARKKTVFCMTYSADKMETEEMFGAENKGLYDNAVTMKLGENKCRA